ncbi:MAG: J domain-containing protein [Treponema sp.]|jgi:hypothetical protein|nr:J domain-containing protein [Treponema sp.]
MAQTVGARTQGKISRLACIGAAALFFFPALEPFLPLMLTVAGSLVLGGLVKFIFGLLVNRKLNQTYRAYSSNAGRSAGSGGSSTGTAGPDTPPARPPDPLKPYRAVFGLPSNFTRSQLKAAYRAMAAQYHPDRYTQAPAQERQKAEEMMKKINEAYHILKK